MQHISNRRLNKLNQISQKILRKLEFTYSTRLTIALLTFCILVVTSFFNYSTASLVTVTLGVGLFLVFLARGRSYDVFNQKIKTLALFYSRQHQRQQGLYSGPDVAAISPSFLNLDFDLYGKRSIYSQINECFTDRGSEFLKHQLEYPTTDVEFLLTRQQQIQSLAQKKGFLNKFFTLGQYNKIQSLRKFEQNFQEPFVTVKNKKLSLLAIATWSFSCFLITLSPNLGLFSFIVFWLLSLYVLGKIKSLFFRGIELEVQFQTLYDIFVHIEKQNSQIFKDLAPSVHKHKPSQNIRQISKLLSFLSIQGNPLLALLLNMTLPWNLFFSLLLEKERQKLVAPLPSTLNDLAQLEFLGSLAIVHLYQSQVYADYTAQPYLEMEGVFHPLIPRKNVIANDFHFNHLESIALITGSNMAGKSTFLRAVGINHIMAMMGAPVFAQKFVTYPSKLMSCIRVMDSVEDGYSYFYAEVKRLKQIIDHVAIAPTFFIVDEIFKGTNNRERIEGGRALLRSLITDHSMGLLTTHDMELADKPPAGVVNWHFSDQFEDGKIKFSYKIKEGPSTTTNALKIMEIEGLIKGQRPRLSPV